MQKAGSEPEIQDSHWLHPLLLGDLGQIAMVKGAVAFQGSAVTGGGVFVKALDPTRRALKPAVVWNYVGLELEVGRGQGRCHQEGLGREAAALGEVGGDKDGVVYEPSVQDTQEKRRN